MLILRKMVNGNFIPAEADVKNRDIEKILTGGRLSNTTSGIN